MTVRFLILALTDRCNLSCACCYRDGNSAGTDMGHDVMDSALAMADQGQPCHVQLTGGEPTLVPDLVERAVSKVRQTLPRAGLGLQTNGTRLVPLVPLIKKHGVQVGISLDGPLAIQEALRGKAKDTLMGLKILEDEQIPFRVTTVLSRENVNHLDKLVLMLGAFAMARGIGLDLLINKGRAKKSSRIHPAEPEQVRAGVSRMITALSFVNRRRKTPLVVRERETAKGALNGRGAKAFCHAAENQSLAVSPLGNLYPCGQTMGDPGFFMGHVHTGMILPESILDDRLINHKDCGDCFLNGCCPGECPSRLVYNGPEKSRLACEMYKVLGNDLK